MVFSGVVEMFKYPEQAKKEATHTDDVGNLYRVFGEVREFKVEYWDRRYGMWCQDMGKFFDFLIPV